MDFQERIQDIQTEINSLRDRLSETDDKLSQFHDEIVNQNVVSEEDLREALMFWSKTSALICEEIWGDAFMKNILKKYSLFEFVNKYKEYKQKEEEDNEIKVGDYVQLYSAFKHTTMIVTHINDDRDYCEGITFDGETFTINKDVLLKTGKHCDILSVLGKLKESD